VSIASRLLKANPSVQVSDTLTGDFTVPSRKGDFYTPLSNQFEGLANVTVTTDTSSVVLSGLSAFDSYSVLRVMYRIRSTGSSQNGEEIYVRWNNISTSTYNRGYHGVYHVSGEYGAGYGTHTNLAQNTSASIIGFTPDASALPYNYAYGYFDMYDAQNTNKKKAVMGEYWCAKGDTWSPSFHGLAHVSHNTNTLPSSIDLSCSAGNVAAGSIVQLYGFKGY